MGTVNWQPRRAASRDAAFAASAMNEASENPTVPRVLGRDAYLIQRTSKEPGD